MSERNVWSSGMPNYAEDANAAITLCDHLAEQKWNCHLGNGHDKTWECEFIRLATKDTHPDNIGTRLAYPGHDLEIQYGAGDTLPQAITEAFLRVKGLWVDHA